MRASTHTHKKIHTYTNVHAGVFAQTNLHSHPGFCALYTVSGAEGGRGWRPATLPAHKVLFSFEEAAAE